MGESWVSSKSFFLKGGKGREGDGKRGGEAGEELDGGLRSF